MNDEDYADSVCDGLLQGLDALLLTLFSLQRRLPDQTGPMPIAWRDRAMPNLQRLRADVLTARSAAHQGELRPTVEVCAQLSGLSRDLDWAVDWMGPTAEPQFQAQREALVMWAARHHREGWRRLPAAGP